MLKSISHRCRPWLKGLLAVLSVAGLAVASGAQTKEYDLLAKERTIGSEVLTASQDRARLQTKTEMTHAGGTVKSELEEEFNADGSNKWLRYATWIKGKKATMEIAWRDDKIAKVDIVDVNGDKSSSSEESDDVPSSTAMGPDLSATAFRIALQRSLKKGLPAKIAIATIPVGAQAGLVPMAVAKVGETQTITISKKPVQVQEYSFTEIPDPGESEHPPVKVWAETETGEIVVVCLPGAFSIVQRGLSPSDLSRLK